MLFLPLPATYSYRWIRFDVCRPGDGQVPHSLSEDDASVNFEAYLRHQGFDGNIKVEHIAGALSISYICITHLPESIAYLEIFLLWHIQWHFKVCKPIFYFHNDQVSVLYQTMCK